VTISAINIHVLSKTPIDILDPIVALYCKSNNTNNKYFLFISITKYTYIIDTL